MIFSSSGISNFTLSLFLSFLDGLISLMNSNQSGPINIWNPKEFTINDLAKLIINKINPKLGITYFDLPQDDPLQRKPVIDLARKNLNWDPRVELSEGLDLTIEYFKRNLKL